MKRTLICLLFVAASSALAADPAVVDVDRYFAYARVRSAPLVLLSHDRCEATAELKTWKAAVYRGRNDETPACWREVGADAARIVVCSTWLDDRGQRHVNGDLCEASDRSAFLDTKSLPRGARF